MKIDTGMLGGAFADVVAAAGAAEAAGYDGYFTAETQNDPFLPLVLAAEHTERLDIGTDIAVALARSPMTLAQSAHDLQKYSKGRMVLGLGSQIRPHIERRFSMPYDKPASRMRELVLAMRAIWATWNEGVALAFEGEFYRHTLMTPFFNAGPTGYGPPRVWLAAVGPRMTEIAGEVADGIVLHAFTTERYVDEVTMPAIERGLALAGRPRESFEVSGPVFIATGRTDEEMAAAIAGTKSQIAFYASTPAYRPVLALHGWGDLGLELTAMTKAGRWDEIGSRITEEMLHAFAVVAPPERLGAAVAGRLSGRADRATVYAAYRADADLQRAMVEAIRAA